jgi:hypothetical protein
MVTSLKQNYGRVEVVVLNPDLIPNMIDTVVIGDRLFSLPIQVEGRVENEEHNLQMNLDDGANNSGNGDNPGGLNDRNANRPQNPANTGGSGQDKSNNSGEKQGNVLSKERAGVPANGQMISGTDIDLDHQNTTSNSILNFNQVNSVRDPSNQENTHADIVLSGLEDAEQNVLLMLEQPRFFYWVWGGREK